MCIMQNRKERKLKFHSYFILLSRQNTNFIPFSETLYFQQHIHFHAYNDKTNNYTKKIQETFNIVMNILLYKFPHTFVFLFLTSYLVVVFSTEIHLLGKKS